MAHPGFGHLWQQAEMSDVDIVLYADVEAAQSGDCALNRTLLQQFPGHSQILSPSPYFKAQVLRWFTPGTLSDIDTGSSKDQAQRQVSITVPHASYEPAVLAVLSGLYNAKPWTKLLADLTPQQQVQAAVLADLWQLPEASTAAMGFLQAAADSTEQLPAVLDELLNLAAVPGCLLPLFEEALLGKYGDLEAVWGSEGGALQQSLLRLPLHAMELLLASDKLEVASEDTVLYTAQAYADSLVAQGCDVRLVIAKLAPLVRCPHLSQLWLTASVLSDDADQLLLGELQPQLKRLLLLRAACRVDTGLTAEVIQKYVRGALASWLLPVRDIQPVTSRDVAWELDVAAIRRAAQDSARQQRTVTLRSPFTLLGGIMWGIQLHIIWDASTEGSTIGLFAQPKQELPHSTFCSCTVSLESAEAAAVCTRTATCLTHHFLGWEDLGWFDFFGCGVMSGGFDEAAWAALGLPTSGSIRLGLTIEDVGV